LIRIDDSQFVTLSQVVNQEDYYKARERGLREFYQEQFQNLGGVNYSREEEEMAAS
jgi:hypothetical protein